MEKKNTLSISNLKLVGIIAAAILAVILVGIFVVQNAQNKAFALEESVEAAMAEIEIQEMRRQSLVYNLADIVKEYDAHEAETLTAIVEGRSSIMNADEVDTAIAAVTEAYPELKSVTNYQQMMTELSITENLIAQYRNNYTEQVRAYNRYCKGFPTRVFLNWLGYEKQDYEHLEYNLSDEAPQDLFGE